MAKARGALLNEEAPANQYAGAALKPMIFARPALATLRWRALLGRWHGGRSAGAASRDNRNDHDRYDGQNADGYRRSLTDVVNLANARGGFESGAGDCFRESGEVGLRRCGRTVRIAVAHGGELPCFYGHANTREIADLHDAVKNNHRHNVVFIADVKIRADDARDTRGGVYLELPVGLRNFLRLRADFSDRHFQVGLLRACVVLHDLHGGIRAHVEYRAVIKRNTRPAVGLGGQHILPVDRSFRAGVHGLRASPEADRRNDAGNFPSALPKSIGECEGIKRNRQRAREQANQYHWIRGFSSHQGLLDTNRTVTTLVTGEVSGGQMKRGKALPS